MRGQEIKQVVWHQWMVEVNKKEHQPVSVAQPSSDMRAVLSMVSEDKLIKYICSLKLSVFNQCYQTQSCHSVYRKAGNSLQVIEKKQSN